MTCPRIGACPQHDQYRPPPKPHNIALDLDAVPLIRDPCSPVAGVQRLAAIGYLTLASTYPSSMRLAFMGSGPSQFPAVDTKTRSAEGTTTIHCPPQPLAM
jgi:hypothetical protein